VIVLQYLIEASKGEEAINEEGGHAVGLIEASKGEEAINEGGGHAVGEEAEGHTTTR